MLLKALPGNRTGKLQNQVQGIHVCHEKVLRNLSYAGCTAYHRWLMPFERSFISNSASGMRSRGMLATLLCVYAY
jgi:hypothetical protein